MLSYNYERGYFIMSGYVKIKASEIPFYISLAQDGMKNHHEFGNVRNLNKTGYRSAVKPPALAVGI